MITVPYPEPRLVTHGLEEVEGRAAAQDRGLGQHLAMLGCRFGAPGDAAAGAVDSRLIATVDHRGADRDAEARADVFGRWCNPTDGAAVDPTRGVLELADQRHGPGFGRSRHRAA